MTRTHDGWLDGRKFCEVRDTDSSDVKLQCLECSAEFVDREQFLATNCPLDQACGKPKPEATRPRKARTPKKKGSTK